MKTEEFRKKCSEDLSHIECCGTPMLVGLDIDGMDFGKTLDRAVCKECGNYIDIVMGQFDEEEINDVVQGMGFDKLDKTGDHDRNG